MTKTHGDIAHIGAFGSFCQFYGERATDLETYLFRIEGKHKTLGVAVSAKCCKSCLPIAEASVVECAEKEFALVVYEAMQMAESDGKQRILRRLIEMADKPGTKATRETIVGWAKRELEMLERSRGSSRG